MGAGWTEETAGGLPCPKCRQPMQRYKHGPNWTPRKNQPYYFAYWDVCNNLPAHHRQHIQHYSEAKVMIEPKPSETKLL